MIRDLLKVAWVIIQEVKEMGEIPGIILIGAGALVSFVSGLTVFVRKVDKPFLFYATLIIGIVMMFYGFFKMKQKKKKVDELLNRRRPEAYHHTPEHPVQETAPPTGPFSRHTQGQEHIQPQQTGEQHIPNQAHGASHTQNQPAEHHKHAGHPHAAKSPHPAQKGKFCYSCGSPLHGHAKFCSNCGVKL